MANITDQSLKDIVDGIKSKKISSLDLTQTYIKNIEEANIMYENMLDKTTESLEKIIKNAETSSNTQQ